MNQQNREQMQRDLQFAKNELQKQRAMAETPKIVIPKISVSDRMRNSSGKNGVFKLIEPKQ